MGRKLVSAEEVSKHSSADDVWIVIDGKIYDMTEYVPDHPGGPAVILRHAGKDATNAYSEIHAPSVITDNLDASKCIGSLDESTITDEWTRPPPKAAAEVASGEKPPLITIINAYDFEHAARKVLSEKNWAFYSSAATDNITRDANRTMFDRIWWRPRLMRNVRDVSMKSKILGCDVECPLFISPAAIAKLAHPDGEKAMARACEATGIIQCISSNSSYPIADIVSATSATHPSFFQLYVNSDRSKTRALITHLLSLRPRIRAIFVTIDAPMTGKREPDERLKADETLSTPNTGLRAGNDAKGGGLGRTLGSYIDRGLCWADLGWIRAAVGPDVPLVIKGVQTAADARLALEAGMDGILVSNHGGRCLDTAPPAVLTLLELHRCCPEVFDRMEVYVDGGIRRGTDIVKCLCLGATAVGIGRHFLYSLVYGQEGVERLVELLKDEIDTTMRLIGITDLSQAHPGLVNTLDVDHLVPRMIEGHPYARKARARL